MKRIILTTALALSFAAPAFAGVDTYTNAQVARIHFAASETGSDSRVYFADNKGHSERAAQIFADLDAEDTGTRGLPVLAGKSMNMSTKGGHNAVAKAIFAELLAAEDGSNG
ncbi:hypothetical protein JI58_07795 [Marinosulfonomonas sp. PRT-SC04]|nr:hypothetical protein JI58_07795 [Marinosulfonomonas sp. PRT-SC04]